MATFHLLNFGCRASQSDGSALKQQLLQAGLEESADLEQSQIAVLNTCTVTAVADAEVRQVIRRIYRANPSCRILVTGCYAQRAPGEIAVLPGVAWVVGNSHKHTVPDLLRAQRLARAEGGARSDEPTKTLGPALVEIEQRSALPAKAAGAQLLVGEISEEFHFSPVLPDDRTRPTLKVQDGCNARCSFCIIPAVRGPSRSLLSEKVIAQVRSLEAGGYKKRVLCGIKLGGYGEELDRRITFFYLLERGPSANSVPRTPIPPVQS